MESKLSELKQKIDKEKKKQYIRQLNEPPHLTLGEEVGNAVTHGVGAMLAIAGMILLLLKSDTGLKVMASCFYGISLVMLMLMSCLYHAFRSGSGVKRLWRRFDYSSIYLLIGGTFAPLYLVYWGNTLGIVLFCVQWGLIILGITMIGVFGPGRLQWLHFSLYFVIGWSALMFIPDWLKNDRPLFWFIIIGGIIYTVGMIPFSKGKKYTHFIWHFFVLAGAVLHWFGIYLFVY
nr:hemolysin III family protein [uncultured Cellulosilyticum sp.]